VITSPTEQQRKAREAFNLEKTLASLPIWSPPQAQQDGKRGRAGARLQGHHRATISEGLLDDFARNTLGAQRCSERYRDALRVVLGNQAEAERWGYRLELNRRVPFTTERTMRTILDQMEAVGLTFRKVITLGQGKCQQVQCFKSKAGRLRSKDALEYLYRRDEAEAEKLQRLQAQTQRSQQCQPADQLEGLVY
jgi:hypothetical protein